MEQLSSIIVLVLIGLVFLAIIFAVREIVAWYFKMNEVVKLLKDIHKCLTTKNPKTY